jgi:NTE family protein
VALPSRPAVPPASEPARRAVRIGLALGGGAARGFAHVGVLRALEAQGITPDVIVGTSAGGVVGALYAAGYSGNDLSKIALQMDETVFGDWTLPDRGILKGEGLQNFINRAVQNRPLERLNRRFAVVATDLGSGEAAVFRQGNVGMAVRASSSVPGVFQPMRINGRDYVDGGLVSPVPVDVTRGLGADIVIAVDISNRPEAGRIADTIDVLLQTFAIMGQTIKRHEVARADVVVRPELGAVRGTDFEARQRAIFEGEKAALNALPAIQEKLRSLGVR